MKYKENFNYIILGLLIISLGYFAVSVRYSQNNAEDINIYLDKVYISDEKEPFAYDGKGLFRGDEKSEDTRHLDEAYRLGSFYLLNSIDPLYVIRNQSEQKDDIIKTLDDLIFINDRFKVRNSIDNDIFPVDFFEAYKETLDSQTDFFAVVSIGNARRFIASLEKLNDSYIKDAQRIKLQMEEALKISGIAEKTRIYQLNNYLSPDIIKKDFDKMIENGRLISKELEKRKKCLEDSKHCRYFSFDAKTGTNKGYSGSGALNPDNQKEVAYEVRSKCWATESGLVSLRAVCHDFLNYCFHYTDLVNDKRFEPLNGKYLFEKSLMDKGVSVIPKNITTPYVCNDYTYQAFISNSSHYDKKMLARSYPEDLPKRHPSLKKAYDDIISLESKISSSKIHRQADYEELADRYAIMQNLFLKGVKMDKDNMSDFQDMNRRYLELKGNLMDMSFFLNKIIFHDTINMISNGLAEEGSDPKQANTKDIYLYFSRNNYSVFFLNFSPFVWKNPQKPEYFGTSPKIRIPSARIMDHAEAIETYGEKNLIDWEDMFKNPNKGDFYSKYHERFGFGRLLKK